MLPQTAGKQLAHSRTIWNKFLLWAKQHQSSSSMTAAASPQEAQTPSVCLSVRATEPANSQGFQVNIPHPETLLLQQPFHTQGNPERAAPCRGRNHIPAAVGLGHPRVLSRAMSCQVLQVSWRWVDGCPPCSCTKGCRKMGCTLVATEEPHGERFITLHLLVLLSIL